MQFSPPSTTSQHLYQPVAQYYHFTTTEQIHVNRSSVLKATKLWFGTSCFMHINIILLKLCWQHRRWWENHKKKSSSSLRSCCWSQILSPPSSFIAIRSAIVLSWSSFVDGSSRCVNFCLSWDPNWVINWNRNHATCYIYIDRNIYTWVEWEIIHSEDALLQIQSYFSYGVNQCIIRPNLHDTGGR